MAQFASDAFTGTSGTELSAYSSSWAKNSGTGESLYISSAGALYQGTATGTALYSHSGTPANADYSVSADLVYASSTNASIGVVGRQSTSEATYYMARYAFDPSFPIAAWQLHKFVAGTATQLGSSVNQSFTSGTKNVKLEMVGTAIKLFKELSGTASISVTDSSITSSGNAGVRSYGAWGTVSGIRLDNFSADDIAGSASDLTGAALFAATASGEIAAEILIVGAAIANAQASGAINQSINIAGSSAAASIANGTIALTIALSGDSFAQAVTSGALSQSTPLGGASQIIVDGTADLSAAAPSSLEGAGSIASSATAQINLAVTLSGSALGVVLASANLDPGQGFQGDAKSISAAAGQIAIVVLLAGSASASATGSGNISAIMPITGASASVAQASGDLTVELAFNLSGNALAQVLAASAINISLPLSGNALASALAAAQLSAVAPYNLPIGIYSIKSLTPRYSLQRPH